jgi:hypothetical protein
MRRQSRPRYDDDGWDVEEDEGEDTGDMTGAVAKTVKKRKRSLAGTVVMKPATGDDNDCDDVSEDGSITDDGGDGNDDDYEDGDMEEEEEDDDEDDEGFTEEEEGVLLDTTGPESSRRAGSRGAIVGSRKSHRGKVKSEDVVVIDDWEEAQYSGRVWEYQEEVRSGLLTADLLAEEVRERARHTAEEEEEEELEEGEEKEVLKAEEVNVIMKGHQQFGDVEPSQSHPPSAEQLALDRSHREAGLVVTDFGSAVDQRAWEALYPYQKRGVEWFWRHYETDGSGGILGDEM